MQCSTPELPPVSYYFRIMALRHLPAQLSCGLSTVAIRTPDDAFRHLLFNLLSTSAAAHKNTNLRNFLSADVIELKHNDVALTAIDAWVFLEKSPHEFAIVFAFSESALVTATIMLLSVSLVVNFAICAVTLTAIGHGEKLPDLTR
jgi:hypothetical protein